MPQFVVYSARTRTQDLAVKAFRRCQPLGRGDQARHLEHSNVVPLNIREVAVRRATNVMKIFLFPDPKFAGFQRQNNRDAPPPDSTAMSRPLWRFFLVNAADFRLTGEAQASTFLLLLRR